MGLYMYQLGIILVICAAVTSKSLPSRLRQPRPLLGDGGIPPDINGEPPQSKSVPSRLQQPRPLPGDTGIPPHINSEPPQSKSEQPQKLWHPDDSVSEEEFFRCRGMPCDQYERTMVKLKQLEQLEKLHHQVAEHSVTEEDSGCVLYTEQDLDAILADTADTQEHATHTEDMQEHSTHTEDTPEHATHTEDTPEHSRKKRKIQDFASSREQNLKWELPIHYKFDGSHSENEQTEIRAAISTWESHTCVRFRERGQDDAMDRQHLLLTKRLSGCFTYVGRNFWTQILNLQSYCLEEAGVAVHELGHTLGLWHEHQRQDRDNWVKVNSQHIYYYKSQFARQSTENYGVPYDFTSVMHYPATAGGYGGRRVLQSLDPLYQSSMGQRISLSFLDAKIINLAYCTDSCSSGLTCERGGYQDPNNCEQCICPDGFSGQFCQHVQPSNKACGGVIEVSESGHAVEIMSPGYTDKVHSYQNFDQCVWYVKAPVGESISLEFEDSFGLYAKHGETCYHYVEVKYTQDFDYPGPRFCGYKTPSVVLRSTTPEMVIIMKANYNTDSRYRQFTMRGFKAKLSLVLNETDDGQGVPLSSSASGATTTVPRSTTITTTGTSTTTTVPSTTTTVPSTTTTVPSTTTTVPSTTTTVPSTPTTVPSTTTTVPSTTTTVPSTNTTVPTTTTTVPTTTTTVPSTTTTVPSTPTTVPSTTTTVPSTTTTVPSTTTTVPSTTTAVPSTTTAVPSTTTTVPNIPTTVPSTTTTVPSTTTTLPSTITTPRTSTTSTISTTTTAVPSTTTTVPNTTTVPSTRVALPSTITTVPGEITSVASTSTIRPISITVSDPAAATRTTSGTSTTSTSFSSTMTTGRTTDSASNPTVQSRSTANSPTSSQSTSNSIVASTGPDTGTADMDTVTMAATSDSSHESDSSVLTSTPSQAVTTSSSSTSHPSVSVTVSAGQWSDWTSCSHACSCGGCSFQTRYTLCGSQRCRGDLEVIESRSCNRVCTTSDTWRLPMSKTLEIPCPVCCNRMKNIQGTCRNLS